MEILMRSKRLRLLQEIDAEQQLHILMKETDLTEKKLAKLILKNDVSCIINRPESFEQLLDVLYSYAFDNFDEIIYILNAYRSLTLPSIHHNPILDKTCICRTDKCNSKTWLSRGHIMCVDFFCKCAPGEVRMCMKDFPIKGIEYNADCIEYLFKHQPELFNQVSIGRIIERASVKLVKLLHSYRYSTEGLVEAVYADRVDLVEYFLEQNHPVRQDLLSIARSNKMTELLYEKSSRSMLGIGIELDLSLPPVRIVIRDYQGKIRLARTFSEANSNELVAIDLRIFHSSYMSKQYALNQVRHNPLDSPVYARLFGIKCSTSSEIESYFEALKI